MIISNLFLNPVGSLKCNLDLKNLEEYCLAVRDMDEKGRIISNVGGWQSRDLPEDEPRIQSLIEEIVKNVKVYLAEQKIYQDFYINPIWININGYKDFNIPHEHPRSHLSGCFYVKVPADSGRLTFLNPNPRHQHYIRPDRIKEYTEFNSSTWSYEVTDNVMILFPAWLEHFVEPNHNKTEERISIAFNIVLAEDNND